MIMERKENRLTFRVSALLICVLSAISCQKEQDKNYFYTYIQSDPGKLDPFYSTDVVSGRILTKICNGLFKIDNNGIIKRDLIDSFTFNGKILKAKLKRNVHFHNGLALNSDDVIFSYERIKNSKNPTSPRRWIFNNIKTIAKRGEHEFSIKLKRPSSTFLSLLTMPNCYIISKNEFLKHRNIIGSGPFILKTWGQDEKIVLEANQNYFGRRSKIKGIVFKIIPEDLTARFEFLNGALDYFELPYLANIDYVKNAHFNKNARIIEIPELSVHYIALNTSRYPFNKKVFRKALNMAIDRDMIMKSLLKNRFQRASGPIPPRIGDYVTTTDSIPYNPSKARKIIKQFTLNNKRFTLFTKSDHQVSLISQMVQYYLKKMDLNIGIQEMDWSALKAATIKGSYDLAYFTWHADYPEPENFLYPLFFSKNSGTGGNRSFYFNEEVDRLLIMAQRTIDNSKRFKIYNKIERIIIDDAPWIFLWYGDKRIAITKRITQFVPYPIYCGFKGNEISIASKTE
ncbi:MAG: ABC transporter substrate-binding protein [Spirochaetota bacterium]|nr:ABC transporter substrate-binding protein [Spirochaetota bacterium]